MTWEKLFIALIPGPLFYLIYYRYFTFRPEYLKHLEAFMSGIAFALVVLAASPYLFNFTGISNPLFDGFIKAAAIEKAGAFCIIILLQIYYPNFSLMESILSSMMFGIGFSFVENVSYAMGQGLSIIVVRILFSMPLHLTTCGIMGYYLGLRKMSETGTNRTYYSTLALCIPLLLHGSFDTLILAGGFTSYLASPMLIFLVIILEVLMARAQTMLPFDVVSALGLRFEDWHAILRQPSYERWILRSMGTTNREPDAFFQWRPGFIRFFFVITFMIIALAGLSFREELIGVMNLQITVGDQVIVFGIFPFSVSMILILVGAVNPDFFKNSKIKIPIISDVEVTKDGAFEEVLVTYDITSSSCFLQTAEAIGIGTRKMIRFECPTFTSDIMEGIIVWENHINPHAPRGSVIRIENPPSRFVYLFMARYIVFRLFKGIVFNLKLPGFESIRKLFMRPISTMQDIRILPAGTSIYNEGDRAAEFYYLKKGKITFFKTKENGGTITLDTIEDEDIFGEIAAIGKNAHTETARCVTDCVVAVADRENLNALVHHNMEFTMSLLEKLARRVQASQKILFENISDLEKEKLDQARLARSALLLLLIGSGCAAFGNSVDIPVDMKKIIDTLGKDDPAGILKILELYMKNPGSPPPIAASALTNIINQFKMKVRINKR
jgi:protease PrsW